MINGIGISHLVFGVMLQKVGVLMLEMKMEKAMLMIMMLGLDVSEIIKDNNMKKRIQKYVKYWPAKVDY